MCLIFVMFLLNSLEHFIEKYFYSTKSTRPPDSISHYACRLAKLFSIVLPFQLVVIVFSVYKHVVPSFKNLSFLPHIIHTAIINIIYRFIGLYST